MKLLRLVPVLLLVLSGLVVGQETSPQPAARAVTNSSSNPATRDNKKAEKLFERAIRLQSSGQLSEALDALETSRQLNPSEPTYGTTEEFIRQQIVSQHLQRGSTLQEHNLKIEAMAEFREALALDPANALADQMLRESSGLDQPRRPVAFQPLEYASEPELNPKPGKQNFHFRGNTRDLLQLIARSFGLTVSFDDSVIARNVRFDVDDVDFWSALQAANKVSHTFTVPMSATEMMVANDTLDIRRRMERTSLRTFYVPEASTPQDLQEVSTLIRVLFDVSHVLANPSSSTVTVRAPARTLDAVEKLVGDFSSGRPQVMLEIQAIQVDESFSRQLGIELPLQFNVFNINTELRNAISPANQALVNQFLSTGQINPADAAALLALLATQQSGAQSPLLKPFTSFGGGRTRTGVGLPPLTAHFNFTQSTFKSLQKSTVRAEQGHAANFHVGDRYPVLTSSFSPLLNIASLPSSLRSSANNLQPLIPSYSYEDLGITLKLTPQVNAASEVTLQVELNLKSLGATSFNGVPVISNREFKGTVSTRDGQTSVIAGSISGSEVNTVVGAPGISKVPGLGLVASVRTKDLSNSQILLLITPYILSGQPDRDYGTERYTETGN